jgi:hypothetical protein
MNTNVATASHSFRAGAVFGGCLLLAFLLPLLGFVLRSNLLFFAPQYLFPYNGFVVRQAFGSRAIFSQPIAILLSFVQWSLATAGFAWFARRVPARYAFPAAIAAIVLIGVGVNLAFGLFGITVELDGP